MFDLLPWRKRYGKDLNGFKNEMDNLFDRFFDLDRPFSQQFVKGAYWAPRVNVSESEKEITVHAELPGCKVADIDVVLEGRLLTIKGKKKYEKEEKEKTFLRVERAEGAFSRMLEMPTDVDQQDVRATYKKGVLKLVLKKTAPSDSQKNEIKTS